MEEKILKGDAKNLLRFLEGTDKRFVIPVYQRNYDWKTEQCDQLFNDLIKLSIFKRKNHFLGSIVSYFNPDGYEQEYLIIDGQQRLTTISILLVAIYHILKNKILNSKNNRLAEKIYNSYLVDDFNDDRPEEIRLKLKSIKKDRDAFESLFNPNDGLIQNSNITINYKHFYNRIKNIQQDKITIDDLYNSISNLIIIDICLSGDDNPQLIFESLNSTGLNLNEGDKIRNYILMGLSPRKQEYYYSNYWNKIEENTKYDVSSFIRDYLSIKRHITPAIKKVYFNFKDYVEKPIKDIENIEDLLKDLKKYSNWYEKLLNANTDNKKLNEFIKRLNRLEITVTRPFFLEIFNLNYENKLTTTDMLMIFEIIESYIFRRNMCDLPTNALNKIFLTLNKEILKLDNTIKDYVEKLKYILNNKKEKAHFPTDVEFVDSITHKNIYCLSSKTKSYLFERLENKSNMEIKNIYDMLDNGICSIEHIIPQHLTPAWKNSLGYDYEEIHQTWLHRLANLTLTSYNSNYSNSTFETKRDLKEIGLKESGFRMNQLIAQKEKWGIDELKERNKYLTEEILNLWKYFESSYQPAEKPLDEYSLDDEFSFTSKTIIKFRFQGAGQPSNSWVDMYQKVLTMLHQLDKSVLNKLAVSDENTDIASHISNSNSNFRRSYKVDENIYVLTSTSTQSKINILKKLFQLYNIDNNELTFFLKSN